MYKCIHVCALCRPVHTINLTVTVSIHGDPRNMKDVVVIWEVICMKPLEMSRHRKHTVVRNSAVVIADELTVNFD